MSRKIDDSCGILMRLAVSFVRRSAVPRSVSTTLNKLTRVGKKTNTLKEPQLSQWPFFCLLSNESSGSNTRGCYCIFHYQFLMRISSFLFALPSSVELTAVSIGGNITIMKFKVFLFAKSCNPNLMRYGLPAPDLPI